MLLEEIKEKIIRLPSGAIITDENRYDDKFIYSIIHTFRGEVARIRYKENKRINPSYYQKHYPEYSKYLQEGKNYVKFLCPPVISLNTESDGLRYAGTIDYSIAYRRIQSRAILSNYNKHNVTKINNCRYVSYLYDASEAAIEIYGNLSLRELLLEAIFANPLDISTFNKEKDNYPIAENDIPFMEELIFKGQTSFMANTQPDYLQNKTDITQNVPQQRKR